jgi:hypothetical protein
MKRRTMIWGVALSLLLGLLVLQRGARGPSASTEPTSTARTVDRGHPPSIATPVETTPTTSDAIAVVPKQLIADVNIEPASGCRGEPIRVEATLTDEGRTAKLAVNGAVANPAVLHFDRAGKHTVKILARDWYDGYHLIEREVETRDCDAVALEVGARATGSDEMRFWIEKAPFDLARATIRWKLGDGSDGLGRSVTHSYAFREQSSPHSTMVVEVVAETPAGRRATGVYSFSMANPLAIAAASKVVALPAKYDRFASRQTGKLEVELLNPSSRDANVVAVVARAFPCDGSAPEIVRFPASDALNATTLRAGVRSTLALAIPLERFARTPCRILARLAGTMGELEINTPIALEIGAPDNRIAVTDGGLAGDLARARELVGPDVPLTPELLEELRASGRL